jgi:hypothetical protein
MTNRPRIVAVALGVLAGLVATAGTIAVAVAGFALSFDAIRSVAQASHIRASIAWMYPVTVDGSMAVATVVAVVLHRMARPVWYPWLVVSWGVLVSIGCNGLHAYQGGSGVLPPAWAVVVSAVPAVNLALSVHLLVTLVEAVAQRAADATPTATAEATPARQQAAVPGDTAATSAATAGRQDDVVPGDSERDTTPAAAATPAATPAATADTADNDSGDDTDATTPTTPEATPAVPQRASRSDRTTTQRRQPTRQRTTSERVREAVARDPDATPKSVAKSLRISVRTVQRYWPDEAQQRVPVLTIAR